MADLLIEIICEEIPARMQARAAADLERLITGKLGEAGLKHGAARHFVAPRHLALYVEGLAERQEDLSEERRGPRADAPEQAIAGFLKSTGLSREQLTEEDTPKGRFLFARIEKSGAATADLLPGMVTSVLADFPWPKSQRWGATRFRWVRPLHRVNVLLGGAPLAGELDLGGASLAFTAASRGHYFEHADDIDLAGVASADDYVERLRAGHVMVDRDERRATLLEGASALAEAAGTSLRANEGLVDEVCGLVEWPSPLFGSIEERFMALPGEVLEASIRAHQKYLVTEDADGALQPGFVIVGNRLADTERDAVILAGNQRVLRARLADAEFFWQEDMKTPLEEMLPRLSDIAFYEGLGSVHDKAMRLEALAAAIGGHVEGCDAATATRAARLAKADLVSGMVGEFPELQGIMGGHYIRAAEPAVADAVAAHYRPQGPADSLPGSAEGCVVSLADKIDSLVGFFGVGAKPTGSKDPFALRRAALGIIRIIRERRIRMPLGTILSAAAKAHGFDAVDPDLLAFIRERLRVTLRDDGLAHDVVAAALGDDGAEGDDDILALADRAAALSEFLSGDDGTGLLAGWRRAASILNAEESKAKQAFSPETDPRLFTEDAEIALHGALAALPEPAAGAQDRETLLAAMQSLGGLRGPIDGFFDRVVVNDDDAAVRQNRLGLLAMVRHSMQRVADFSKLEG
ncbi:MAG: glycine--tRNA ligase subunit beta [Pseudomonadota bacterium]|jgi:glycyl-tRNA synthetase beta chain|nr:glycine--tRNA ligase subunit beta [Pseudomonadota bacterium]